MPRNRREKGKKKLKKSRPKGRAYTKVIPKVGPLAPDTVVVFRYTETISTGNITTLAVFPYVFRANSIFDPNRTGTGHQPYAYDTYGGIYNRYLVTHCKATVTFCSTSDIYECATLFSNGSFTLSSAADFNLMREMPYSKAGSLGFAGTPNQRLSSKSDLCVLNGATRAKYNTDDNLASTYAANPTEVIDFNVGIYNASGVTLATTFTVTLEYRVRMWDPLPLAISLDNRIERMLALQRQRDSYLYDKSKICSVPIVKVKAEVSALTVRVVL
jgi:hypothetical protein